MQDVAPVSPILSFGSCGLTEGIVSETHTLWRAVSKRIDHTNGPISSAAHPCPRSESCVMCVRGEGPEKRGRMSYYTLETF